MRYYLLTMWLFATVFTACNKSETTEQLAEDHGCIHKIFTPVTSHGTLSDSMYGLTTSLFTNNGIYRPDFRYLRSYEQSAVQTYNGVHNFRNVHVLQYTNGLPIFTGDLNYLFIDGLFSNYAGNLTEGTSLNTNPSLTLAQVRKLFLNDVESFDHAGTKYKDSCLRAEFGYYNLNSGVSNSKENLVKAWHVNSDYYDYPEAFYQDATGKRIYYFNGIVYFK